MAERFDKRQERDDDLSYAFCDKTDNMAREFEGWLELELKDCLPRAEILALISDGSVKEDLDAKIGRMRQITLHGLPETMRRLKIRCREIRQDGSTDLMEDYDYLEDCLLRLHRFVQEVLDIRAFLDTVPE
jgi:hypothetical protein